MIKSPNEYDNETLNALSEDSVFEWLAALLSEVQKDDLKVYRIEVTSQGRWWIGYDNTLLETGDSLIEAYGKCRDRHKESAHKKREEAARLLAEAEEMEAQQ
jgi:hypothetical protein